MRVAKVTPTTRNALSPSITIGARSSAEYVALYAIVKVVLQYILFKFFYYFWLFLGKTYIVKPIIFFIMSDESEAKKKLSVTLSVNKSVDDFMKLRSNKVIDVDGKKIYSSRTKNEVYNRAIEYAIEHCNEWD